MNDKKIAMVISDDTIPSERSEVAIDSKCMRKSRGEEDHYCWITCIDLRSKSLACQLTLFIDGDVSWGNVCVDLEIGN